MLLPFLLQAAGAVQPVEVVYGAQTEGGIASDLDLDGHTEDVDVGFTPDHGIAVQLRAGNGRTARLVLPPSSDVAGPKDHLNWRITEAHDTGIPLIRIELPGRPMCGSGDSVHYLSWTAAGLQEAASEHTWSDVPVYSRSTLAFHPDIATAVRTSVNGHHLGGEHHVEVEILELVEGVFVRRTGTELPMRTAPPD